MIKKTGLKYEDLMIDYINKMFEKATDFKTADAVYNKISQLTPKELSEQANNVDYDIAYFRRDAVMMAYNVLWKFYEV